MASRGIKLTGGKTAQAFKTGSAPRFTGPTGPADPSPENTIWSYPWKTSFRWARRPCRVLGATAISVTPEAAELADPLPGDNAVQHILERMVLVLPALAPNSVHLPRVI